MNNALHTIAATAPKKLAYLTHHVVRRLKVKKVKYENIINNPLWNLSLLR